MSTDPIDVTEAATILRVLANSGRLRIVLHLQGGEKSVAELELDLAMKQPNLSQYLGELRDAGLVVTRRESRSIIYQLADEKVHQLMSSLVQGFGGANPSLPPAPRKVQRRTMAAAAFAVVREP